MREALQRKFTSQSEGEVMRRNGIVIDVRAGTLYISEPDSNQKFFSTFGRIKGYRGESKGELATRGLHVGGRVFFTSADNEKIDSIEILSSKG